ncbi:hypothetical protein BDZ94DRAFT_1258333 [Collybia nuda]|uniref:DUF6534 domain-containing protein n=1 Tax=Collybia nuda TaxID=64659 RepID=A0A9P6CKE9_9AGAR|nr:hypothetical protein BDZ94DRAFT_1258333 [Collybia nuda]
MSDASAARLLTAPFFLGSLFSYGLYGVLSLQVYTYYQAFPKDNNALKTTVGVLFFLDTVITVISTILGWHAFVTEWGTEHAFAPFHWSLAPLPLLSCIVAVIAQGFYSWRIYKLRANTYVPVIIMLISLVSAAFGAFSGIRGQVIGIARDSEIKAEVIVWLGGSTICDVMVTSGMVISLYLHRQKVRFEETRTLMSRLITLTIETGMVTAITAIVDLLFFLILPSTNMHFIPFLALSKLYTNCLLTTLNSRPSSLRRQSETEFGSRATNPLWIDLGTDTTPSLKPHTLNSQFSSTFVGGPQVHIATSTRKDRDIEMLKFDGESAVYNGNQKSASSLVA